MSCPDVAVAAFYHFAPLDVLAAHRTQLTCHARSLGVRGTILLAREGINGTIAGSDAAITQMLLALRALPGFDALQARHSRARKMPFDRMKVRLKREIVTMGVDGIDPNTQAGEALTPEAWQLLLDDPDVVVIDTRNDFEVRMGSFEHALNPHTGSFGEFPAWLDAQREALQGKKIAMFCTGGIRCEKATSYARRIGLDPVYHLKGGILAYLEQPPPGRSRWQGHCFVFDQRVALGDSLRQISDELLQNQDKISTDG